MRISRVPERPATEPVNESSEDLSRDEPRVAPPVRALVRAIRYWHGGSAACFCQESECRPSRDRRWPQPTGHSRSAAQVIIRIRGSACPRLEAEPSPESVTYSGTPGLSPPAVVLQIAPDRYALLSIVESWARSIRRHDLGTTTRRRAGRGVNFTWRRQRRSTAAFRPTLVAGATARARPAEVSSSRCCAP